MLFNGAVRLDSAGTVLKADNIITAGRTGAGIFFATFARAPVSVDNVTVKVSQGGNQDMTCNWTLSLSGGNLHIVLVFDIDTVNTDPTNGCSLEVTEI